MESRNDCFNVGYHAPQQHFSYLFSLSPTHAQEANCDPSYPGVCIPPCRPDLNCGDISDKKFEVLPPDPHGFDGEGDGIGCES